MSNDWGSWEPGIYTTGGPIEPIKRKCPISWSILKERAGQCIKCGWQALFKDWEYETVMTLLCPKCSNKLPLDGASKGYYREGSGKFEKYEQ